MIKEEEWVGGVTMFAGPPPVEEKMELPDEFFKVPFSLGFTYYFRNPSNKK